MSFGGCHPYPRRFGGSRSTLEAVHRSLGQQRGTALDATNESTVVWLETMALARAIVFDGWHTNQRLAHQWDPRRMTDMLTRWEAVLRLRPGPLDPLSRRRGAVGEHLARFASTAQRLRSELPAALGDAFVALEFISLSAAFAAVPDGTYPWGSVVSGVSWMSTVALVLVRTQVPDGWSEADFLDAVQKVPVIADRIAPAWVVVDWYRAPESAAITVPGGASAAGFYLDDEHNLDNNVFDT